MFKICPGCLSPEGGLFCAVCGVDLTRQRSVPLFYLKVGWSRSRDFEKILRLLREEQGYRYKEVGEEVAHLIPVWTLKQAKEVLVKYEKALKWKETSFQLESGTSFSPLHEIALCFMRLVVEGISPCQEGRGCPYERNSLVAFLGEGEHGTDGSLLTTLAGRSEGLHENAVKTLFLVDLMDNATLTFCPFYRSMVSVAATAYSERDPELWSFYSQKVRDALARGSLILDPQGALLQMGTAPCGPEAGRIKYESVNAGHISHRVAWGAKSGSLELISDGSTLYRMPGKIPLGLWERAAAVAPTSRGRFVVTPPKVSHDATTFLVLGREREVPPVSLGPFPVPWGLDPSFTQFAFFASGGQDSGSTKPVVHWGSAHFATSTPTLVTRKRIPLEGELHSLRLTSCSLALHQTIGWDEGREEQIEVFCGDREGERLSFERVLDYQFLGEEELVVLSGVGRQITFWSHEEGRRDYVLLLKAERVQSTSSGNVVLQFEHALLEMSPRGRVLDYRAEEEARYLVSSEGYLRVRQEEVTWHFLDPITLEDCFPDTSPERLLHVEFDHFPEGIEKAQLELFVELALLLKSYYSPEQYKEQVKRLYTQAPARVRKEITRLERTMEWLGKFRKNKRSTWQAQCHWTKEFL